MNHGSGNVGNEIDMNALGKMALSYVDALYTNIKSHVLVWCCHLLCLFSFQLSPIFQTQNT